MSEEKKNEKKGESITINKDTINNIIDFIIGWYPMIKIGARWVGVKIPDELDEIITARQQGKPVDLDRLRNAMSKVDAKVGEPVLTRPLAEEAWYLHNKEGMGTREIADYFTNERNSPCSHATIARWINMIDMERKASKIDATLRLLKYGAIAGICALSAYLAHLFW